MARVRIKICGITRLEDAMAAAELGADAVGFVFYRASPRFVEPPIAAQIASALPAFVSSVGLFVDQSEDEIANIVRTVPLSLLQFHGDESPAFCERVSSALSRPFVKAIRVDRDFDLLESQARYQRASALLLDAFVAGLPGGTGQVFDWQRVPARRSKPLILSGGLTPGNVAAAIRLVKPWAVDVSSGVEAAKGIKDANTIAAFVRGVSDADV